MKRLFGLALTALALWSAPVGAQAFKPGDPTLIPQAEAALREIGIMTADFKFQNVAQINTGRLFVDRVGGRLRMEFDPPLSHLLVANGSRVDFIGGDGTIVNAGTQSTPLKLIFGKDASLSGDAEVLEIAVKGANAYFAVGDRTNPDQGKVILHFERTKPIWTLHGWGFIDPEGRYTKTVLSNRAFDVDLDASLFVVDSSRQR